MSYHWTNDETETLHVANEAGWIELAGVIDDGADCERVPFDQAHFFSVYVGGTDRWEEDPTGLYGALCVANRDTLPEARAYAESLASRFALEIREFHP